MELSDYLAIVRRSIGLLIGIVLVATLLAFWLAARQPTITEGSLTATVFQTGPAQTQVTTPYQFDSFYTLQAAGLFGEQLKASLADPEVVAAVFEDANAGVPAKRLSDAPGVLTVRKLDPAAIQVIFDDPDQARVMNVLTAVGRHLTSATSSLQEKGAITNIRIVVGQPYLLSYHSSIFLAGVVAFVASIFTGLALIFLIEFARPRLR